MLLVCVMLPDLRNEPVDRAKPQSITSTSPKSPSMTFSGFRSRWITPREWANATASATFIKISMFSPVDFCSIDRHPGRPLHALHRIEQRARFIAPQIVDRDDVRVIEIAGDDGFGEELFPLLGVRRDVGLEHLDRDGAIDRRLPGGIDDAHAAFADHAEQLVFRARLGNRMLARIAHGPVLDDEPRVAGRDAAGALQAGAGRGRGRESAAPELAPRGRLRPAGCRPNPSSAPCGARRTCWDACGRRPVARHRHRRRESRRRRLASSSRCLTRASPCRRAGFSGLFVAAGVSNSTVRASLPRGVGYDRGGVGFLAAGGGGTGAMLGASSEGIGGSVCGTAAGCTAVGGASPGESAARITIRAKVFLSVATGSSAGGWACGAKCCIPPCRCIVMFAGGWISPSPRPAYGSDADNSGGSHAKGLPHTGQRPPLAGRSDSPDWQ